MLDATSRAGLLCVLMRVPAVMMIAATAGGCASRPIKSQWDLHALSIPPKMYPAPGHEAEGLRGLFYEGPPWNGKPTRVFAWYGAPATEPGEKLPAMVLVHGGGGTAFEAWVRLWVQRGYAAIAMDTTGCTGREGKRTRHQHGGPEGWGGFNQIDQPIEDQWPYHAVADVILAHSLIRSFPEVDTERIGITGISWGGYLTCIVAGVDHRFRFAVPVYGCGFLGDNSAWLKVFENMGEEKADQWLSLWDPSGYVRSVPMPIMWVTGTNDGAYPLDSVRKTYRCVPGNNKSLCIRIRMPHGHGGPGENPEEIRVFADSIARGGTPLARITGQGRKRRDAWATFSSAAPIPEARLCYTRDAGKWTDRKWEHMPATLDVNAGRASATLPVGTTVYYFNLIDDRNCVVSSEHQEISETNG